MKKNEWKLLVLKAVRESSAGDDTNLNLLASYLEETDKAKQSLRDKGYGWTGLGILETVQAEVPPKKPFQPPEKQR